MTDTRTKILNAASELFLEGGAAALSVRAIASKAGLSTIGIYSHFQGKQGILDTLYIQGFNMVYDASNVLTDGQVTAQNVLQASRRYLRVAQDYEAHYRLIFGEAGMGYEPSSEARAAADRSFDQLVSLTSDFIQGSGLTVTPIKAAMDIWALLHGYVSISHHARAKKKNDYQKMALEAVAIHLTALK